MERDTPIRKIRRATANDFPTVQALIQAGRQKMMAAGNTKQWSDNRPSPEQLRKDIALGNSYLVTEHVGKEERVIGTFAFIAGPDPTYSVIDGGKWLNDAPYCVLHRVATANGAHGIMRTITDYCFTQTKNIRIDTHEDNKLMQGALKRLGFAYCGIIYLEDGDKRLAFQKEIG